MTRHLFSWWVNLSLARPIFIMGTYDEHYSYGNPLTHDIHVQL